MDKTKIRRGENKYMFIGKSVFFPEERILAFGDLHLGYEKMLKRGVADIFLNQLEETKNDLNKIFKRIKEEGYNVNVVVILGDIKHSFGYDKTEEDYIHELVVHLQNYVRNEKIIFIRGNHDRIDLANKTFRKFYVNKNILFTHGNESFHGIYDPKIKYVVMSHLHPTLTLSDKQNIKREKYKCFLVGHFKDKEFIVVPSFLSLIEGSNIDEYEKTFSVVPYSELENFNVFIVGNDWIARDFGKFKYIQNERLKNR
jgi:putative SbcD/Mre11-related phosphoesterase